MNRYVIFSALLIWQLFSYGQIKDSLDIYNSKLKQFVEQVSLQKNDGDIAKIPQIESSLERYINYCLCNNISAVDDYAFYMTLRLFEEYLVVNKWDYEICFMNHSLIKVVLKRMEISECIFVRTGDIYEWVKQHIDEFNNYPNIAIKVKQIEKIIDKEKDRLRKKGIEIREPAPLPIE